MQLPNTNESIAYEIESIARFIHSFCKIVMNPVDFLYEISCIATDRISD